MAKNRGYASGKPARYRRVDGGAVRIAKDDGKTEGTREEAAKLDLDELKMLMILVRERVNVLAGMAAVDGMVKEERGRWRRLLEKLGRMNGEPQSHGEHRV